jgi:hypothetical protein
LTGWIVGEVLDDLWVFSKNGDTLYILTIDDLDDDLANSISFGASDLLDSHSLAGNGHPLLVR